MQPDYVLRYVLYFLLFMHVVEFRYCGFLVLTGTHVHSHTHIHARTHLLIYTCTHTHTRLIAVALDDDGGAAAKRDPRAWRLM